MDTIFNIFGYMLKLIKGQLDSKLIKLSLISAFIYCLLFNSVVIAYKFDYYKVTLLKAILELTKDFIYIYIFSFIIFFGLSIHRLIFVIGSLFLFITSAIASYYLYFFHIAPTKEMMGSFFSTDFNEIYELVSIKLIIWLLFSLSVCIYTIKHFTVANSKLFVTNLLSALCLLIFINNIIAPQFKILNSYFPIQYLHNTYLHLAKVTKKHVTRDDISSKFTFKDNSDSDIIGILVIGESARFDHFGINGYNRDTTPYLTKLENIFSFKAQSASNHTYISVPSLLSRHNADNLDSSNQETSFLSILTKIGFNTDWVGTQSLIKYLKNVNLRTIYDEVLFSIIPGGSALFKMNDHDGIMLPYIESILNSINIKSAKKFLVIHTSGSHWNYAARYPNEFEQFKPSCKLIIKSDPSSCDLPSLINNYDNTILYTDFFLYNVISLLKNRNAFLIYVSDHGESLGENGNYGHGGALVKEQTTVPFIVWVSDQFKAKHLDFIASIKSHLKKEISHDYVFHSILDCLNIESEIIDKNLSLCNSKL